MSQNVLRSCSLAVLALLAACGSSGYRRTIQVSPPESTIFVNGERLATGSARLDHEFTFDPYGRAFLQITAPEYEPVIEILYEQDIVQKYPDTISKNLRRRR